MFEKSNIITSIYIVKRIVTTSLPIQLESRGDKYYYLLNYTLTEAYR